MTINDSDKAPDQTPNEVEVDLNAREAPQQYVADGKSKQTFNSSGVDLSSELADASPSDLLDKLLERREEDLIPWEEVRLPSAGYYYNDSIPDGIIKIKAMGVAAEKILATPRLAQSGQAIDYLFENCVQFPDPEFKPSDLLAGDRVFILYVLRGITHGNIYEFAMKCPSCSTSFTTQYDLNDLSATIKGPNYDLGNEPFEVTLPYMSQISKKRVWVGVRLLRSSDISQIANRQRFGRRAKSAIAPSKSNEVTINESLTENLNLAIVNFMGDVSDPYKIKKLVERMHSRDTSTIRQFLKENSPQIDTSIIVSCPDCSNEIRTELPITESFFRPSKS